MIQAAIAKGVKKFVLVTSLGCGSSKGALQNDVGVVHIAACAWERVQVQM